MKYTTRMLFPKTTALTVLITVLLLSFTSVLSHPVRHEVVKQTKPKFECWSTPADLPSYELVTTPCFPPQGVCQCRCSKYLQDCSSNFGSLTYLPQLSPRAPHALNFCTNGLQRLDDPQFFSNISGENLWLLDLYNNNMTYLVPKAITRFHKLTTILIGGNRLSYKNLRKSVFSLPTLTKLDIKCGGLGPIPTEYFNGTLAVNLEQLDMSWNMIGSLDLEVLQPLGRLRGLTMWHNALYNLTTAYMPSLRYISFHKNRIVDFPRTCRDGGTHESLFPQLTELDLNFNLISVLTDPVCLPKLRTLNLQYNRIQRFCTNMFSVSRFPSLMFLELNQMESQIRVAERFSINNSNVVRINFGLNELDFSSVVHPNFFGGCSGVWSLFLNRNNFERVSTDVFRLLFQPMPGLQSLYLENTGIETLNVGMFSSMAHLKRLNLKYNLVSSVPDRTFDDLPALNQLLLSNNRLTSITSNAFSATTRARLHKVDLSGNPFQCSCDIEWFQQWLKTAPSLFVREYGPSSYSCANLHNVSVEEFVITEQACLLSHLTANDIIIFASIIIVFFLLVIVMYGHRWHLRLWLYEVCRGRHERRRRQQLRLMHPFQYDVFLAYAEEDKHWVQQELLPVLEEEWGLRVCVHQRDFVPGKHIIDNISDCVEDSDRAIMVFSPHFARSPWCQYELRLCQTCVMERDDVMVLLMLEETESRDMTGPMLAMLRTTTYIEWADEPPARASFWGRLKLALNDVIEI